MTEVAAEYNPCGSGYGATHVLMGQEPRTIHIVAQCGAVCRVLRVRSKQLFLCFFEIRIGFMADANRRDVLAGGEIQMMHSINGCVPGASRVRP